jgi:outer membrane receptor protein involved in Fe transport
MTLKTTKLRDAIKFALVVGAASAMSTGAAIAQDEGTEDEAATLDAIVVTGTRIQSQTVTASSPVVEINRDEFQFSGATRVDDLVNQYPQLSTYFDSFANNGSTGYPTIDLRGLGPQRTLTLVNGNRLPPGAAEVRDISMIPASLVSRVDILTGGASAVYGSDAIAGVVNFVLDTEFEGVSITAGYSAYQHKNDNSYMQGRLDARNFDYPSGNSGFDGVSKNVDIAMGGSFADGAGHATAWVTYRENDPLFQGERDYSSCALNATGTACGGSATNAAGNFYVGQDLDGDGIYSDDFRSSASLNPDGSWNNAYGAPYNYAPINYYQRPDERYTFGASLKYEINENFRPYMELMYVNKGDSSQIAESGAFFTFVGGLTCDNPLVGSLCADLGVADPTQPFDVYVAKRNVEGGPRIRVDETNSFRIVAGLEGSINDNWSYNTSVLHAQTRDDSQGLNDFLNQRIVDGILGCPTGSFSGCVPYNIWEPNAVTQEAAAALAGTSIYETATRMTQFNAYVTGDTGFGFPSAGGENISLVVGTEWREEKYDFQADSDSQAGNFAGAGGPATPVSGGTKVTELFLESIIPVLTDVGFVNSLSFDVGYRYSDYDLSGTADTYKFGFAADFGMVRARGGYNRAIRAPGINELFSTQSIALWPGSDPCEGATPTFTVAQCENTGLDPSLYGLVPESSAGQYNQFVGGNPNLKPEQADTYTFGVVITPIENLTVAVDYYDIFLEDAIGTIGASTILTFCGITGDPFLCDRVNRSGGGDLWRGSDPATSGFVSNLTDNFGERSFRGIDLGVNYRFDALGGRFATSLQGSYLLEQEITPLPGVNDAATYDCAGLVNPSCQAPEWRHIANVRYSRDWYTVNLRWRYFGAMDYILTDGTVVTPALANGANNLDRLTAANGGIDAYNYFDLSASAYIGEYAEFTVGVNNIADKEPPLVAGALAPLNGNSLGGYDQAGRYFFTSVTFKF